MTLNHTESLTLVDRLGESAETVISIHLIRQGLCRVFAMDDHVIIQNTQDPAEPTAFGENATVLWELLQAVEGWKCINLPDRSAPVLGEIIAREEGLKVRYYGDIYHELRSPAMDFTNDAVRLLTGDDVELLETAAPEIQGAGFHSPLQMLTEGVVAGGIINGKLVSIAHTGARSSHYADIGVSTLPSYRQKGLATAATSIVASRVQADGQIPVWSCGEDNMASLRVAEKAGFRKVLRRTYVIPER